MKFDRVEKQILTLLQEQGRISNVELAEQVGLSESPTFRRVRQLEDSEVISGYGALVDQRKLGLEVTAFVQVSMEKQPDSATDAFHERVNAEPHIIECHAMSGSHDYLMKVVVPDMPIGGAQAIRIHKNGVLEGASDPRKDGAAIGY